MDLELRQEAQDKPWVRQIRWTECAPREDSGRADGGRCRGQKKLRDPLQSPGGLLLPLRQARCPPRVPPMCPRHGPVRGLIPTPRLPAVTGGATFPLHSLDPGVADPKSHLYVDIGGTAARCTPLCAPRPFTPACISWDTWASSSLRPLVSAVCARAHTHTHTQTSSRTQVT